jgi:50S ribosomal protein L16 3-hydroxylase
MAPSAKLSWPLLGKISQKEFLTRYWQKKPLLMKGAIQPFPEIISPEELAGMTLDKQVESRLIIQGPGKNNWQLKRGPFKTSTFQKLPKKKWTVLVNGVDRFVPSVHAFLDEFSFIPFWRMDDIMISYAVDQGNVGAHVDNFDVFLVQAAGKREWMIEDKPVMQDDFIPDLPVRLLRKFKPTHRWVLEPGDILYLPPRFPHHGVAQGDRCMTISVGCRAPSTNEIINGVVTNALIQSDESVRYTDPDLKPQAPGEISADAIAKIKKTIEKALLSDEFLSEWLGRHVTDPYSDVDLKGYAEKVTPAKVASTVKKSVALVRTEGSRLAYVKGRKGEIAFYVNGDRENLSGKAAVLAQELANRMVVPSEVVMPFLGDKKCLGLLASLLSTGALVVEN